MQRELNGCQHGANRVVDLMGHLHEGIEAVLAWGVQQFVSVKGFESTLFEVDCRRRFFDGIVRHEASRFGACGDCAVHRGGFVAGLWTAREKSEFGMWAVRYG